jgi:ABC-type uncharacterized transport system substrate-binding protein
VFNDTFNEIRSQWSFDELQAALDLLDAQEAQQQPGTVRRD